MSPREPEDFDEMPDRRRRNRVANQVVLVAAGGVFMAGLLAVVGVVAAVVLYQDSADERGRRRQPPAVAQSPPTVVTPPAVPKNEPRPRTGQSGIPPRAGELRPEFPAPQSPPRPPDGQPDLPGVAPGTEPTPPVPPAPSLPLPIPVPEPVEFPQSEPRPKKIAIPGYYARKIHGFNVLISRMAYDQSDEMDRRPIGYLETEFARIAELLPPDQLKVMARRPIWVEWDHTVPRNVRTYGIYYGSLGESLAERGVDPRKAKCVCLLSLKTAYKLRTEGKSVRLVILHELAHAVHDQHLGGSDNTVITNAYEQAKARGLYSEVRHIDQTVGVGYAARNEAEYFAELTCAYLDRLDYTPVNRAELKEHDSVGYELMAGTYGTPAQIEARKKRGGRPK